MCGAVHLRATLTSHDVVACHCDMCRNWGGGPLFAVEGIRDLRIEGEENVSVYRSSDWAERGFCRQCGTHLFYRLLATGDHVLPVGLLEESPDWSFEAEIYVDERPAYYEFANDTRKLTGKEVMEMYQSGSGEGGSG
jgi:hypothetical protein